MPNPITGQPYDWEVNPVPATPNYTDSNFAFGYSQPMGSTAMNQASLTNPQAQPMGSAALTTPNPVYGANAFNVTGTNQSVAQSMGAEPTIYGSGNDALNTMDAVYGATGVPGMSTQDWLGFGFNTAGLLGAGYLGYKNLQAQDRQLGLAEDQFNYLKQQQQDLDDAYASFQASEPVSTQPSTVTGAVANPPKNPM